MNFKVGHYVTGTDRSYARSIYQIVDMESKAEWKHISVRNEWGLPTFGERAIKLRFCGLKVVHNGTARVIPMLEEEYPRWELHATFEKEFRHATSEELAEVGINI